MTAMWTWQDWMGALSVLMALVAFAIYVWQTVAGEVRPHPLSFLLFGILSAIGYWVQRVENAGAGSWTLAAMTAVCFSLAILSVIRGERHFSRNEWAFLVVGFGVLAIYLVTQAPVLATLLITLVDALGYGPTFVRGWHHPDRDSVTSYALNGVKFVPSLLAMQSVSVSTCFYPATILALNLGVVLVLVLRRRANAVRLSAA
jgi:hypothetical protein